MLHNYAIASNYFAAQIVLLELVSHYTKASWQALGTYIRSDQDFNCRQFLFKCIPFRILVST